MKKYVSIIILSAVFMISGCSDQLERVPVDQLVEETAYQTVSDLQRGLAGAIGNYDPTLTIAFNSIFTDNARLGDSNGGQELNTLNQILTADGGDRGIWTSNYSTVNDFNRLLVAAEGVLPGPGDVDEYNNILAQCYAFRALLHYEVLLYYGLDITNPAAPGVPYVDYVSVSAQPARNTTGEVIEAINADLDLALSLFPAGTSDINFATPDFVTFLRARMALETGDNQGAITFCNQLIGNYPLANQTQYFDMFNEDANTLEVIYKYDSVQGFNLGINFIWNFTGQNPFVEMSSELYNLLNDSDIRKLVLVDPASDIPNEIYVIGKYPINADTNAINDFKAMRISEIYLIRAEAYAKLGQFGPAAADVAAVRSARFGSPQAVAYSNLTMAATDILAERRLELAFEGHRYIDIKRLRPILNIGIERDEADCLGATPCSLPVNSPKFTFPIPTGEINGNPNITQAPGYGS